MPQYSNTLLLQQHQHLGQQPLPQQQLATAPLSGTAAPSAQLQTSSLTDTGPQEALNIHPRLQYLATHQPRLPIPPPSLTTARLDSIPHEQQQQQFLKLQQQHQQSLRLAAAFNPLQPHTLPTVAGAASSRSGLHPTPGTLPPLSSGSYTALTSKLPSAGQLFVGSSTDELLGRVQPMSALHQPTVPFLPLPPIIGAEHNNRNNNTGAAFPTMHHPAPPRATTPTGIRMMGLVSGSGDRHRRASMPAIAHLAQRQQHSNTLDIGSGGDFYE